MDSERYSDFNALRTERDRPFERPHELKRESLYHKDVMEGLGNIFRKLEELDGNIGKRLEEFLDSFAGGKAEETKNGEKLEKPEKGEKTEPKEGEKPEKPKEGEKPEKPKEGEKTEKAKEGEKPEKPKEGKEVAPVEVTIQSGGSLEQIMAAEVNQLMSDVQALQKEVTESEQTTDHGLPVQSGGGCKREMEFEGKFMAMQCEIDVLKKDVNSMTENMLHLLTYFNARSSRTPMKLKAGMEGGHIIFRAEPK